MADIKAALAAATNDGEPVEEGAADAAVAAFKSKLPTGDDAQDASSEPETSTDAKRAKLFGGGDSIADDESTQDAPETVAEEVADDDTATAEETLEAASIEAGLVDSMPAPKPVAPADETEDDDLASDETPDDDPLMGRLVFKRVKPADEQLDTATESVVPAPVADNGADTAPMKPVENDKSQDRKQWATPLGDTRLHSIVNFAQRRGVDVGEGDDKFAVAEKLKAAKLFPEGISTDPKDYAATVERPRPAPKVGGHDRGERKARFVRTDSPGMFLDEIGKALTVMLFTHIPEHDFRYMMRHTSFEVYLETSYLEEHVPETVLGVIVETVESRRHAKVSVADRR